MQLTMSMFATQADYWKARAELAEKTVEDTAKELGCEADNELMLQRANHLRKLAIAIEGDPTEPAFRREYARNLVTPNVQGHGGNARHNYVPMSPKSGVAVATTVGHER